MRILRLTFSLIATFLFALQLSAKEYVSYGELFKTKTNEFVGKCKVLVSESPRNNLLILGVDYPYTETSGYGVLGAWFGPDYQSTSQNMEYDETEGHAWVISSLKIGNEEAYRNFIALYWNGDGYGYIYQYKKPSANADPVYMDYYVRLSWSPFIDNVLTPMMDERYIRHLGNV